MSNANLREKRYSEDEVIRFGLIPSIRNRITLWKYRRDKKLGFYRIGNRVFYGESHLSDFLARCERKAKGGVTNA